MATGLPSLPSGAVHPDATAEFTDRRARHTEALFNVCNGVCD